MVVVPLVPDNVWLIWINWSSWLMETICCTISLGSSGEVGSCDFNSAESIVMNKLVGSPSEFVLELELEVEFVVPVDAVLSYGVTCIAISS